MTRSALGPTGMIALALLAAALTGCAQGPSPAELEDRARDVFDALATDLAAADPAVVRAVEVADSERRPCGEEGDGTQTSFVATGTLAITAEDSAAREILGDLADSLDPDEWDGIRTAADGQDAWADADGVVVTTTLAAPAFVVAVFTPCAR